MTTSQHPAVTYTAHSREQADAVLAARGTIVALGYTFDAVNRVGDRVEVRGFDAVGAARVTGLVLVTGRIDWDLVYPDTATGVARCTSCDEGYGLGLAVNASAAPGVCASCFEAIA